MPRRLPVFAALVAVAIAAFLLSRPAEIAATQNTPQLVAALKQELQESRERLERTQQQLVLQGDQLRDARRQVASLTEELRLDKQDDRGEVATTIRRLRKQLVAMQSIKYAHYSVWKRKPFAPNAAVNAFLDDVYGTIAKEGSVRGVWAGGTSVPDAAGGEIALLLLFDDRDGHKQYQEDPATRQFSEKHGRRWEMVKALDVLVR